jgi:hypothetical protein
MGSKNLNQLLSYYLQGIVELYRQDDSCSIIGYCQLLKELLYSALNFLPGNFSKENVEIEINQKLLPGDARRAQSAERKANNKSNAACKAHSVERKANNTISAVRQSPGAMPLVRIWNEKAKVYGYIDILEPGTTKDEMNACSLIDLNKLVFPNLILTNFFEFRYYRAGKKVCTARPFSFSHINGITNNVKVASMKLFLKELQHFMGYDEKKARDSSFINLQQRLALKTYYLREYVLFPVMNHLIVSGSKCELVRIYRAYCYFFDLELSVREFSAFLAHVIIDGYLRAGIFYSRFNYINENHFSRVRVKEFANLSGMKDRRLALFKYLSSKDDQLPVAVKWMLDDISWLIAGFDFKQMGFDDNKKPWLIDGDMLQWQDYFFKPYYENEEYKGVLELLKKAGIFSSEVKSPIQNDKVKRII